MIDSTINLIGGLSAYLLILYGGVAIIAWTISIIMEHMP